MAASPMTAAEVALRLGIKRASVYAYVSRGLLTRTVASDGRTSQFDPAEVDRLRTRGRADTDGELHTLITTRLTRVDDDGLFVGGLNLVKAIDSGARFTEIVDLLWESPEDESWPVPQRIDSPPAKLDALDRLRWITVMASANDPMRHDRSDRSIRTAGRSLITAMATQGLAASTESIVEGLWIALADRAPAAPEHQVLETALSLLVDHGLASSTFAVRVAASARADPYSVVGAGLGVLGGTLHGAASADVHDLFATIEREGDPVRVVADTQRRLGLMPGFGHTVYTKRDPRCSALMARIVATWADDPRLQYMYRVRDIIAERSGTIPNIDLALGTFTWLAGMPSSAGEVIFAVARTAGWLAHAMEEYEEQPLRFRPKARYLRR